ncbi:MAG: RSP_2647 family RNA methyltransferase [Pseudomonadota bacterium]
MTESDEPAPSRPILRLKPKAGRRFFAGAPWIYADEPVLDRRTRKIAPGTIAELQSAEREPLGAVAVNLDSGIAARLLDRDPGAEIDRAWFEARLRHALSLRERLFEAPVYRLVHAEADGLPGVVIDRFGEAAVIQPNAAWADARLDDLAQAVEAVTGVSTLVLNRASRARAQEGLPAGSRLLSGALEGPVEVSMNGAVYLADLLSGQKTGLYLDQRPNHAFVAGLARGTRMLDVFAHVGGFALAGLAAGAREALAVDGSEPALALAAGGARRMGVEERLHLRREDAFDALEDLGESGERFEVVVCDPPAFAPNKQALANGLRAYARLARLAARATAPDGFLTLCSCSHAVDADAFRRACADGLRAAGREAQLIRTGGAGPDHPEHPALPETGYLKALTWRLG